MAALIPQSRQSPVGGRSGAVDSASRRKLDVRRIGRVRRVRRIGRHPRARRVRADLHDALRRVAADGWFHVILDGKVFTTDRCAETTTGVQGKTIDAGYSGKHVTSAPTSKPSCARMPADLDVAGVTRAPARPERRPRPRCARRPVLVGVGTGPAGLADSGYEGAGHGVYTPIKQPADGRALAVDNRAYNLLLRSTRCRGEQGFALLTQRWRTLHHITASPGKIGCFVKAGLVLTHFEHRYLPIPC